MHNPQIVVDNVLAPKPLTLGQFALLERINSPFLGDSTEFMFCEMLPSLYVLSMPPAEALQHLDTVDIDALTWADTLSVEEVAQCIERVREAITAFVKAIPKKSGDNSTKKA